MSDQEVRAACGLARRKLTAARKHLKAVPDALEGIPNLFGDLDGCLESNAGTLSARARELVNAILARLEEFDQDMRAATEDRGHS